MASAAAAADPSDTECAVCHEYFTEPKLLPCVHLLCHGCLLTTMKTQPKAACPLCRDLIVDLKEQPGQNLEDIVDSFPTDHAMIALVEATKLLSKPHVCKVCVDISASSLCLDCGDMLCCRCTIAHSILSATSHHTVKNLLTLTVEQLAAKRPVPCTVHTDKSAELYCPKHDKSICFLCATTDHRTCTDLQNLEEKMEEARAILSEYILILTNEQTKFGDSTPELDQRLVELNEQVQRTIKNIDVLCDEQEENVRVYRQQMKDQIKSICDGIKDGVCNWKAFLLQQQGKLTPQNPLLQRIQILSPRDRFCHMISTIEKRINDLDANISALASADVFSEIHLTVNEQVLSKIQQLLPKLAEVQKRAAAQSDSPHAQCHERFHTKHGKNIVLFNNYQTARRVKGDGNGIVTFREPMKPGMLYEVKIDKVDTNFRFHSISLGVLSPNPDCVELPDWSGHLKSAFVISPGSLRIHGKETECNKGLGQLLELKVGSRIGLALSGSKQLHVFIDGENIGAFASNATLPLFPMFDLLAYWKQITACPVSTVSI